MRAHSALRSPGPVPSGTAAFGAFYGFYFYFAPFEEANPPAVA